LLQRIAFGNESLTISRHSRGVSKSASNSIFDPHLGRSHLAGLAYFLLATATITLTATGSGIATFWPANAALVALLLTEQKPRWGMVLTIGMLANIAANLMTRGLLVGGVLYGATNLVEVVIATHALRSRLGSADPTREPRALGTFILWAGLIAPGLSAIGGGLTSAVVFDKPFLDSAITWYLSDALGLLIFTPVLAALFNGDYRRCFAEKSRWERCEALGLQLVVTAMASLVFFATFKPFLFTLFPAVMLVSFRTGRLGTQASVLLIAIIGAIATLSSHGPIVTLADTQEQQPLYFQFFLAILFFTCLPVTAGLSARNSLAKRLFDEQRALVKEKQVLAFRAATDPLTDIFNRAGFMAAAQRALVDPKSLPLWLIAVDVDHFKQINDKHGHQAGDEALIWIASVLRSALRQDDVLGRLGGDEFLALLPARSEAEVRSICERLVDSVSASPKLVEGRLVSLSISCGGARLVGDMSIKALMHAADDALYKAKAAGRNRSLLAA